MCQSESAGQSNFPMVKVLKKIKPLTSYLFRFKIIDRMTSKFGYLVKKRLPCENSGNLPKGIMVLLYPIYAGLGKKMLQYNACS